MSDNHTRPPSNDHRPTLMLVGTVPAARPDGRGDNDDLSEAVQQSLREAEAGIKIAAFVTLTLFTLCAVLGIWLVGKASAMVFAALYTVIY